MLRNARAIRSANLESAAKVSLLYKIRASVYLSLKFSVSFAIILFSKYYITISDFERHAEVVHSHLLEMMDPARHMHPGVPYDFYSGYVVVEAQNLGEQGGNSGSSRNACLLYTSPRPRAATLSRLPSSA